MATDERTKMARKIFTKAEEAKTQFISTYELLEQTRAPGAESKGPRGRRPSSSLQSLRAMLVFAGAGLDSVVQQILKDSLQLQVEHNEAACGYFKTVVGFLMAGRHVTDARDERDREDHIDKTILREALLNPDGSERFFIDRILSETDDTSFQSQKALEQAARLLGVLRGGTDEEKMLKASITELKGTDSNSGALKVRNQIVHDFDIDLSKAGGRGKPIEIHRSRDEMEGYADQLLAVAENFILAVEADMWR